jgi:hypothetical protein
LCVDGDPARRLASAAELAARLRALPQRRAEARERAEKQAAEAERRARQRRLRFAAVAAAVIAAVAVPLAIWALVKQHEAETARATAETQRNLANAEKAKALGYLREASRSDFATAQARLAEGKWKASPT